MIALLIIAALVALYLAWRVYSQIETEKKDRAIARSVQALPKEPDAFGEKFPNPTHPLKTETLEDWLKKHPEPPPLQQTAIEVREPEPKPFLSGKLLPPKPRPLPPMPAVPHVRKRKRKK